jgi:signal transduction histidine kinase
VRFRITMTVTLLFGVTLAAASVFFVRHLQDTLVADVHESDIRALQELWTHYEGGTTLSTVLTAPQDRPGMQVQVIDTNGDIVAATAGAPQRPLDPRLQAAGQRPLAANGRPAGSAPGNPQGQGQGPQGQGPQGNPQGQGQGQQGQGQQGQGQPGQRPMVDASGQPLCGPRVGLPFEQCRGPNGQIVPAPPLPANLPVEQAVRSGVPNTGDGAAATGNLAVTALPVSTANGEVNLIAASSLNDVQQSVDALARSLQVALPVLILLIAASSWLMTGRALRPVEAITSRVEDITGSTLHERVPVPAARDEVAHLAVTMNAMLERLESSASRQRQFVSDASHELRSPVSSIRTEIEVAMLHPDQADWAEVARNVLAEDERLEQIVGDLLLLARLDEQPAADRRGGADAMAVPAADDVDLDDVVRAEARRARRLAVDAAQVHHVRVTGRPEELRRLVGHLLDNAARHGERSVAVSLHLIDSPSGPQALLAVDDDGPGVPVDQRGAIFERFGRLEEGRSRDRGGAGLGLAVVRRIVERQHGAVRVSDSTLGGARFEVELPAVALDAATPASL